MVILKFFKYSDFEERLKAKQYRLILH